MYKLYTPKTATAETPAPGVLLLHGYQNDHETCAAYAIKLARRGAVVLCLDEYGHGSTTAGLINRGYVNHKVTVNYGEDSVEDGTARRMELLNTNHRLTTHNAHGLATALTWFSDTIGLDLTLAPTDQVAMTKETLVLIAMLAAVASLMAVMELLLTTPFFSKAVQPLPGEASVKPNGAWWRGAIITMLLAAATYPFMTQLGHGLLPLPENIFRMTVGNGFLSWYSLLILIMLVTSIIGYQKTKSAARRTAGRAWGSAQLPRRGAWAGACSAAARCWCCACWRICACCFLSARRHFCWTSGSSGRSSRPLTQPGSDSSASIFRSLRCSLS